MANVGDVRIRAVVQKYGGWRKISVDMEKTDNQSDQAKGARDSAETSVEGDVRVRRIPEQCGRWRQYSVFVVFAATGTRTTGEETVVFYLSQRYFSAAAAALDALCRRDFLLHPARRLLCGWTCCGRTGVWRRTTRDAI